MYNEMEIVNFLGVGCLRKEMFGLEEWHYGYELLFRELNMTWFMSKKLCNSITLSFMMIQSRMYLQNRSDILRMFAGTMSRDSYSMVAPLMMMALCTSHRSRYKWSSFSLKVDSQLPCSNVTSSIRIASKNAATTDRSRQLLTYARVTYGKSIYLQLIICD